MSGAPKKSVPAHVDGLLKYLSEPAEKANEDLALAYFRKAFGDEFTRQQEAQQADGYVPGSFVLELKGKTNDWLSGLFQGVAYRNRGLDFSQVVVATKEFLAIWRIDYLPEDIIGEISQEKGAPSRIGRNYARKYAKKKNELLKTAVWNGAALLTPLMGTQPDIICKCIAAFEMTLKEGRKVRQQITVRNFTTVIKEMKAFFDPNQPIKVVRAFYSMIYSWSETATISISLKRHDQATLGGEPITALVPSKREQFKEFVERQFIIPDENGGYDEYFARFDEALDAADEEFRVRHGIFFTDLDLSRFGIWFAKNHIEDLGRNYLVVDPACGSGNLVTNWRSPLELRHKVVSEIEPELLFAVERRMKGDAWHNGKFTVVPKVSENRGLNFLDRDASDYLEQLRLGLKDKGLSPDKPLAFLCNPPYRSDDDQTASAISYGVHQSIIEKIGIDAANERYCCFLAQMKLVCEAAKERGLPGESLLLLFTKSAWLTKRPVFQDIRTQILGSFEQVAGFMVEAKEFFDVKGSWPVAFTVWRYKGRDAVLDANRSVELIDLTWFRKKDLSGVPWDDTSATERRCRKLLANEQSRLVRIGIDRTSIREWAGGTMTDFKRDRRVAEKNARIAGGLPMEDRRQSNKKTYGEADGQFIGFMDDLTPCRVKNSIQDRPWLNVDNRFMAVKRSRCFSGPPTHLGYCATDLKTAKKLFFWYVLSRTFVEHSYPMWIDADGMWAPTIPDSLERITFQTAFAIGYGDNECVEVRFPANDPVQGAPELLSTNPMTPLNTESFWSQTIRPYLNNCRSPNVLNLVDSVDNVFAIWASRFQLQAELQVDYQRPYFLGSGTLTSTSGLIQIKDFAVTYDDQPLLNALSSVQDALRVVKREFYELVMDRLNYFGNAAKKAATLDLPTRTRFEKALCRRLALAGLLVGELHDDPHFGRTKFAKLFYLADAHQELNLETEYYREAAGPLDQRALYNERFGIEALGRKYKTFDCEAKGKMTRYKPAANMEAVPAFAVTHLKDNIENVLQLAHQFRALTTEQSEIVATLYACWNDFLLRKRAPTDDEIISEFLLSWHEKKKRFSRSRLSKALDWMRDHDLVPRGAGRKTKPKTLH